MSDQPAPREQTIRQLVEKLSGCMDPKNALTLVLESVALLDQLRTEGQPPPREHANFDGLVSKLAMEAVTGIKPLLPDASYGQDVALVAHLIDTLRQQLAQAQRELEVWRSREPRS
jgi:hypothetical protein